MIKMLACALAGLVLTAHEARATAQRPERILVNGQVHALFSTPLAPLLSRRPELEETFSMASTALQRGYIGTWHVEGDHLHLGSLVRPTYDRKLNDGRGGVINKEVPLSILFGVAKGPIPATWYSGTLCIPKGVLFRSMHMGFGAISNRDLLLEIVRGRVIARRTVDALDESRGRSGKDIRWVAMASDTYLRPLPKDDGLWIDARKATTPAFRTKQGTTPFRTRGVLDDYEDGSPCLWIPKSLVTPEEWIPLTDVKPWPVEATWPHVELEVTWSGPEQDAALQVRWLRILRYGETIHHRDHRVREFTEQEKKDLVAITSRTDPEDPFQARTFSWVNKRRLARLRGTLVVVKGVTQIDGVDVAADAALVGKEVTAQGMRQVWIITQRLLDLGLDELKPFRTRGPGTYRRLVNPVTGRLAKPRLVGGPSQEPAER